MFVLFRVCVSATDGWELASRAASQDCVARYNDAPADAEREPREYCYSSCGGESPGGDHSGGRSTLREGARARERAERKA